MLLTFILGCVTQVETVISICNVELSSVEPQTALPGESVVVTGKPFSTDWDTAVYIGGEPALLTALSRDGCDDCDSCRETSECTPCSDCDACDQICKSDCSETATVEVPALENGQWPVQLFNSYGTSSTVPLTIGPEDTGDTAGKDTADSTDSGSTDSGAGASDSGATDTADTASSGGSDTASSADSGEK